MLGPPVAAYIQSCIEKIRPLLVVFGPPPLRNPSYGPAQSTQRMKIVV